MNDKTIEVLKSRLQEAERRAEELENEVKEIGDREYSRYCQNLARVTAEGSKLGDLVIYYRDELKKAESSLQEASRAEEALLFIRNEYSDLGGRGCPACEYQNGKFIKLCKLHEQIGRLQFSLQEAEKEIEQYRQVTYGERELPDADLKQDQAYLAFNLAIMSKGARDNAKKVKELESKLHAQDELIGKCREALERVNLICFSPGVVDPFKDCWIWYYKCQNALNAIKEE